MAVIGGVDQLIAPKERIGCEEIGHRTGSLLGRYPTPRLPQEPGVHSSAVPGVNMLTGQS